MGEFGAPGWYADAEGHKWYWDGQSLHERPPPVADAHRPMPQQPKRSPWVLVAIVGLPILAAAGCIAAISATSGGNSQQDDAYIRALTTGSGMRAHPNWVASRSEDELISAGQYYCDQIKAGDGMIAASVATMKRFHLPAGESGIMGVTHAASEVYCPQQ